MSDFLAKLRTIKIQLRDLEKELTYVIQAETERKQAECKHENAIVQLGERQNDTIETWWTAELRYCEGCDLLETERGRNYKWKLPKGKVVDSIKL